MKLTKNYGMLLLGAWLVLSGLIPLLELSFKGLDEVMTFLAIAAGVLLAMERAQS